jgi:hypothetical protein
MAGIARVRITKVKSFFMFFRNIGKITIFNHESIPKSSITLNLPIFNSVPLPPDPLPHQGKGETVLIKQKPYNQRFKIIRIPLPSLFGEGLGVG